MLSLWQNLDQIKSNVVKKNKGTGISIGFFHILRKVYIYKQKDSGYRNIWVEIEDYIS